MDTMVTNYEQAAQDYQRIEQAIVFLERNYQEQPSLKEIADSLYMSEYHFQRLFTRWVGISPKRFLQYLTKEHAKEMLAGSANLLETAYDAGLSSPGRLHDLFVTCEAVTPGEYKSRGEGIVIMYGYHPTPFGEVLLAVTERGISNLIFIQDDDHQAALAVLRSNWQNAELREDTSRTASLVSQIFAFVEGNTAAQISLHLRGSNFQIKVWEALLRIPPGSVVSYQDIAGYIGQPGAVRAVGHAIGQNPVPVLIPCHRVIRKMGLFGGYRYGSARKKALHGWELAKQSQ